jgi:hypothetical protein
VRGNAPGSSPLRPTQGTTPTNPTNPPVGSKPATPGKQRQYPVRPGDTLSGIALRELGDASRWREIRKSNGDFFTDQEAGKISVGSSIYLPVTIKDPGISKPKPSISIQPLTSITLFPVDPFKIRPVFDMYEERIYAIKDSIKQSAESQKVSSNLVGSILLDELKKRDSFDDGQDILASSFLRGLLPEKTSLGIAQMQITKAKELLGGTRDEAINALLDPYKAADLVARYLRQATDQWKELYPAIEEISNGSKSAAVLATLYSNGTGTPKPNPMPNDRGEGISNSMNQIERVINSSSLPPSNLA